MSAFVKINVKNILSSLNFLLSHKLTKGNTYKTVIKFLTWQLAARLLGKKIIVPWVDDSKFIVSIGETGLTGNIYAGFFEYEDMLFLLHSLSPSDTFVDVGANSGAYTILASKIIRSKSIAFEPIPETIERLKDQIQINRINNLVMIVEKGVADKVGFLSFTKNRDTSNKVCFSFNEKNQQDIEVTTLDCELDINKSFFLKIDVEGFEWHVINGGKNILSSPNVIALIIESNDCGAEFGKKFQDIHNILIGFGFTPVVYEPISRKLTRLNNYNHGCNTIYVKDIDIMASRCKLAPLRCVHTAFDRYL